MHYLAVPALTSRRRGTTQGTTSSVIHSDPEILGGTPVFVGTRVPLKNLIDYLAGSHSLDEFLDDFPSISRDQVVTVLEEALEEVGRLTSILWEWELYVPERVRRFFRSDRLPPDCEAAGIAGEEVGLAADEMPDMNRRSDGSFPTIHFRIRR